MSEAPKQEGPILSPFQPKGPKPPHMHIEMEHHEIHRKNTFLTMLADIALLIIGLGAVYTFSAYPPGSPADIAGTIALLAYLGAAVQAIREHSENNQIQEAKKELTSIIKNALKNIPHV